MQTLTRPKKPEVMLRPPRERRRRFSPLMLIGAGVTVLIVVAAVAYTVLGKNLFTRAAAPNPNCTLIVPNNPLSAQGLATPYQLFAPDAAQNGPCNEANVGAQSAFVQATIFDPANGTFSVYTPLVIDQGTQPAVAPVVPTLPPNAVVGIWFGFNGTNLTLQGASANTLQQGNCINGLPGSVFGQFSYCNAPQFFGAVNQAIGAGNVTVPALGLANDGFACPSTREFSIVDQDQSDNVQTQYLVTANGQIAQLNAANQAQLAGATVIGNPSDNALVSKLLDPPLGCTPWSAPDLANNGTPTLSLALDEIQAAAFQQTPVALVPAGDPMVLMNNNNLNLQKTNLYRIGVDQPQAVNIPADANTTTYCQNMFTNPSAATGIIRAANEAQNFFQNQPSPMPAAASTLANFMAMRMNQSFTNLNCGALLNMANPITLVMDGNGVVVGATYLLPGGTTIQIGQQAAAPTPTPVSTPTPAPAPTATPTPAPAPTATPTPVSNNGGGQNNNGGGATPTPVSGNNGNTPTGNGSNNNSNTTSNSNTTTGNGTTTNTGGNGVYTGPSTSNTGSTPQQGNTTTGTQQTGTNTTTTTPNVSLEVVQLVTGVYIP